MNRTDEEERNVQAAEPKVTEPKMPEKPKKTKKPKKQKEFRRVRTVPPMQVVIDTTLARGETVKNLNVKNL